MDVTERLAAATAAFERLSRAGPGGAGAAAAVADLAAIIGSVSLPLRRRAVRPDDLLAIDFQFDNLRLVGTAPRRLVRVVASRPSRLIATLQGQAVGERDFQELDPDNLDNPTPETPPAVAPARLSGPSRLAFAMPGDAASLDFTLDAILDACRRWPLSLDALARPDAAQVAVGLSPGGLSLAAGASMALGQMADGFAAALREAGAQDATARLRGAAERAGRAAGAAARRGRIDRDAIAREAETEFARAMRFAGRLEGPVRDAARAYFEVVRAAAASAAVARAPGRVAVSPVDELVVVGPLLPLLLRPHAPGASVTAIEAPYRIFLTPLAVAAWAHALRPVERTGRVELWHTRLARRAAGGPDEAPTPRRPLRAIWSHDYDPGKQENDYTAPGTSLANTSPTPRQRDEIVRLSAGYDEVTETGGRYDPRSIPADKVMLSTLGAALDLEGNWSVRPDFVNVSQWRHVSNWGRDHYVRIVEEGFLCPFGHRAALVSVTERKFENAPGGGRAAYLRKRYFIIVRERSRRYPDAGQANGGRDFPFAEVEILTAVTPSIIRVPLDPGAADNPSIDDEAFVPFVPPADFRFKLRLRDIGGGVVTAAMPLTFVFAGANKSVADLTTILAKVNKATGPAVARRTAPLGGAAVQYAPIDDPAQGADVVLPTDRIEVLAVKRAAAPSQSRPGFAPAVGETSVEIPALKKLFGGGVGAFQRASYATLYKSGGFGGSNPAKLFLGLAEDLAVKFGPGGSVPSSENSGGFFEPNMAVQALSAAKGAVADAANAAAAQFDPREFFKGARLLGGIEVQDIFDAAVSLLGADAPEFVNVEIPGPEPRTEARIRWKTPITKSIPLFKPGAGGSQTEFDLDVLTRVWLDGRPPETTVKSTLTHFKIDLFGLIILWFDRLRIVKEPGKKPDVDPDLHPQNAVVFGGPLEFVNTLSDMIPSGGFSDPPVLDISPSGIVAGYDLDIPDAQLGVLSLTNMSLGARLRLPFDGDPVTARFNFAEREDPFNLTVSLLGGGGFFAITVDSAGMREVEMALEFGAQIALDIGVASGRIYAKGGFYFHLKVEAAGQSIELTAYVEMGGECSVLGLITVSVKFYIALSYYKTPAGSELRGQASLIVEIEVLFFSFSVTLKVQRKFAGSKADPRFIDFIPDQATWDSYAAAFA